MNWTGFNWNELIPNWTSLQWRPAPWQACQLSSIFDKKAFVTLFFHTWDLALIWSLYLHYFLRKSGIEKKIRHFDSTCAAKRRHSRLKTHKLSQFGLQAGAEESMQLSCSATFKTSCFLTVDRHGPTGVGSHFVLTPLFFREHEDFYLIIKLCWLAHFCVYQSHASCGQCSSAKGPQFQAALPSGGLGVPSLRGRHVWNSSLRCSELFVRSNLQSHVTLCCSDARRSRQVRLELAVFRSCSPGGIQTISAYGHWPTTWHSFGSPWHQRWQATSTAACRPAIFRQSLHREDIYGAASTFFHFSWANAADYRPWGHSSGSATAQL